MEEAQDMFRNANKVTRPEKALILGFMAGSRGNSFCTCILDIKCLNFILFKKYFGNLQKKR